VLDGIQDNVKHIDDLLERARLADAAVHAVAAHAQPAGDPDPYRDASGSEAPDGIES
jgi:ribosome-binding factor A